MGIGALCGLVQGIVRRVAFGVLAQTGTRFATSDRGVAGRAEREPLLHDSLIVVRPARCCADLVWQLRELTDEILASELLAHPPRCNRRRRHCHSGSVLCLLGSNGSDRVDGDKLYALLVGSRRDPCNGSRPDRNDGAGSPEGFAIATGCS